MMGPMFQNKPGTDACIISNHKSLHVCFFIVTGGDLSAFQQDWGRIMNH